MFDRVDVKPESLASLVEVGHEYADLRRSLGYPIGSHDYGVIYRLECRIQDASPEAETISVAREDVDRLWELRRRLRLLEWRWPTRVVTFYVIASYVFIGPFVFHHPCFAVLAPFGAWVVPYFPFTALMDDPLSGARLTALFVLGLWVSWQFSEAVRLGAWARWRSMFLAVGWVVAVLLVMTQFEQVRFARILR